MKKKFLASLAMVMALTCSFAACGGGGNNSSNGGTGDKIYDGEELFISMRLAGFGEWLNDYAEEFEEETGCEVTINWNPSLGQEVRSIFMSDSYVLDDLYFAGATDLMLQWQREGRLLELTGFDDMLRDEVKDLGMINGKRYSIDAILPPMGLIYNQEYLDAIPTSGEYTQGQFPETFQGLLDLCDKINEMGTINGVAVKPMSWGGQVEDLFDMYKLIWSQGNGGVDYENFIEQQDAPVEAYFKSQSIKNALEGMLKLLNVENGYSKNSIQGCGEKDNIAQQQNFLNGECVFCPSGSWFKTEMKDSITSDTFEFGFANMPLYDTNETTRTTLINVPTDGFFIPAKAENADIALEFLKFVFKPENCVKIHKDLGTPLAFKYDFTEEDILSMDKYSQQVTRTVFDNKMVLRGSSNPMFSINVTCGRFMNSKGDQINAFDGLANGTYTFSDIDSLMANSYLGFVSEWSQYRKAAGLD
mgnify:FL=1